MKLHMEHTNAVYQFVSPEIKFPPKPFPFCRAFGALHGRHSDTFPPLSPSERQEATVDGLPLSSREGNPRPAKDLARVIFLNQTLIFPFPPTKCSRPQTYLNLRVVTLYNKLVFTACRKKKLRVARVSQI